MPGRMNLLTRRGLIAMLLWGGMGLLAPGLSYAAAGPEDETVDGRMEGYSRVVNIEKSSTTPTFLFFGTLVVVGCTGLFKTAKRG